MVPFLPQYHTIKAEACKKRPETSETPKHLNQLNVLRNPKKMPAASKLAAHDPIDLEIQAANLCKNPKPWVLPPLINSWIIFIIGLDIVLNRTPNIDCYWEGAVPNLNPKPVSTSGQEYTYSYS